MNGTEPARVFYDGRCPLCHRLVAFAVTRDTGASDPLRFAPIGGTSWRRFAHGQVPEDTVAVRTPEGRLLTRTAAVVYVLEALAPPWPAVARALSWVPASVRDALYGAVARRRRALFGTTEAACPAIPQRWRSRFEVE